MGVDRLGFTAKVACADIARLFALREIFSRVETVPGHIVEIGVGNGSSFFAWAHFLDQSCPGDSSKKLYGFDTFQGNSEPVEEDGMPSAQSGKILGGRAHATFQDLVDGIRLFESTQSSSIQDRLEIVRGNAVRTIEPFLVGRSGFRISILFLDVNLYEPTRKALESFWPHLSPGGLVVFDDYGSVEWPGETIAADRFLASIPGLHPLLARPPAITNPTLLWEKSG